MDLQMLAMKLKGTLAIITVVLSLMGIVTFSLFILEESFQTIMFGTWPAQDANRWDIVLDGSDMMENVAHTMKWVNYSVGWIQPLAFISYGAYQKSAFFYVEGLRAKAFAHEPGLFVGRDVTIIGRPRTWRRLTPNAWVLEYGQVHVISREEPNGRNLQSLTGRLVLVGNTLFLERGFPPLDPVDESGSAASGSAIHSN